MKNNQAIIIFHHNQLSIYFSITKTIWNKLTFGMKKSIAEQELAIQLHISLIYQGNTSENTS
jgi:hypothetical protein